MRRNDEMGSKIETRTRARTAQDFSWVQALTGGRAPNPEPKEGGKAARSDRPEAEAVERKWTNADIASPRPQRRRGAPQFDELLGEIDRQHRHIFTLIWEFYALVEGRTDRLQLLDFLDTIIRQVRSNFATKGLAWMMNSGPSGTTQKRADQAIMDHLAQARSTLRDGPALSKAELIHAMDSLIVHYYATDDLLAARRVSHAHHEAEASKA